MSRSLFFPSKCSPSHWGQTGMPTNIMMQWSEYLDGNPFAMEPLGCIWDSGNSVYKDYIQRRS